MLVGLGHSSLLSEISRRFYASRFLRLFRLYFYVMCLMIESRKYIKNGVCHQRVRLEFTIRKNAKLKTRWNVK